MLTLHQDYLKFIIMHFQKSLNKKAGCLLFMIVFLLAFNVVRSSNKSNKNLSPVGFIYGKWKITKVVEGAVSGSSEDEVESYIGMYILLEPKLAMAFGDSCTSPNYSFDTVNTDTYLTEGFRGIDKNDLSIITNKIVIITISCKWKSTYRKASIGCADFIKINDKEMIVGYSGNCYFLSKEE